MLVSVRLETKNIKKTSKTKHLSSALAAWLCSVKSTGPPEPGTPADGRGHGGGEQLLDFDGAEFKFVCISLYSS